MRPYRSLLGLLPLCLVLAACAGPLPPTKDDLLASAGFKKLPIKSEAHLAAFRTLQPQFLTKTSYKGRPVWAYADAHVCGCLYVGSQAAYDRYLGIATRNMAAQIRKSDTTDDGYVPNASMLDSGPWDEADMYGLYLN